MKYTISIADDEPRVRKGLQSLISARGADWEVCGLYHDGKTALAAAGEQRFDVLLADIRMPGMDGLELASALRAVSPETVVVVMSGYKEFDYARRAMKIGVLDFLVKPIEEGELFGVLDRARREIERRKSGRGEIPSLAGPDNTGDALFEEVLSPTAPAEAQEKLFAFLGLS
ncbi:MAG TPA: response regulator, partial [Spirochaetia bacterium]|nr:response regulator [Spirochaetia bacterium]